MNLGNHLAELLHQRPGGRKAKRSRGKPPAIRSLAHEHKVFLHQFRSSQQRRLAISKQNDMRSGTHFPLAGQMRAAVMDAQIVEQERKRLRLRRFGACLSGKHLARVDFPQPGLFIEIGIEAVVDFQPFGKVERRKSDTEQRMGTVKRGMFQETPRLKTHSAATRRASAAAPRLFAWQMAIANASAASSLSKRARGSSVETIMRICRLSP